MNLPSHATHLRAATANDASAIVELAAQLGYPVTVGQIAERLARLPAELEKVVVAMVEGKVCAWMQIGVALSIESAPFAEIRALVVDEKLRSSGIGSQLVDFAREWALTKDLPTLRVRSNTVRAKTHAFYLRRGFVISKEQKVFSLDLCPSQQRIASTN